MTTFLTASGRYVPEAGTDQAGSDMLVRTVSQYTDGTAIERPQVCVSLELHGGDVEAAKEMARDLDRRGYLPPDPPMTRKQHADVVAAHHIIAPLHISILWDVLGLGVPLGTALERAGIPEAKRKNARTAVRRLIKKIGWGSDDEPK